MTNKNVLRSRPGAARRDPKNIIRRVRVDRTQDPLDVLKATNFRRFTSRDVVASMPRGQGDVVEVEFFNVGHYCLNEDLDWLYKSHGLTPIDPYSLAGVNRDDSTFAEEYPNGTYWINANGEICSATFDGRFGERSLHVDCDVRDWDEPWWLGGYRK